MESFNLAAQVTPPALLCHFARRSMSPRSGTSVILSLGVNKGRGMTSVMFSILVKNLKTQYNHFTKIPAKLQ